MQELINGGIYSVELSGEADSDFIGEHPVLIFRTLKEEDILIIVPLTTYTKDKWEKCKRVGFGCRILSTNSIARVDKIKIINKRDIKVRWMTSDHFLIITPDELINVSDKVFEYIKLTNERAIRDYNKYFTQYNDILQQCNLLFNDYKLEDSNVFNLYFDEKCLVCKCNLHCVNELSIHDIYEIFRKHFELKSIKVVSNTRVHSLFKNILLNDKKVLTIKEKYDKLKEQKGK